MKLKTLYRNITKVERKLRKLWKNYESREGSFIDITKVAVDLDYMDYEDKNYGLIVDIRWGFYVEDGQNNYQYSRTFYIDVNQFNPMYLSGRMEQVMEGED